MMKCVLTISALLISFNVLAETSLPYNFSSTVLNATQQPGASLKILSATYPMVYGGQDISRQRVATANESMWSGQKVLIG